MCGYIRPLGWKIKKVFCKNESSIYTSSSLLSFSAHEQIAYWRDCNAALTPPSAAPAA